MARAVRAVRDGLGGTVIKSEKIDQPKKEEGKDERYAGMAPLWGRDERASG